MENPIYKWMMAGDSPMSGNRQMAKDSPEFRVFSLEKPADLLQSYGIRCLWDVFLMGLNGLTLTIQYGPPSYKEGLEYLFVGKARSPSFDRRRPEFCVYLFYLHTFTSKMMCCKH